MPTTAPSTAFLDTLPPDQRAIAIEGLKFVEIEKLRPQGQTTNPPSLYESVLADIGGWRSDLAKKGLYIRGALGLNGVYDLLSKNPVGPIGQQYNGQKFTASEGNTLSASYRFAAHGADISQLNISLASNTTNYSANGPNKISLSTLDLYQSFNDRKVEIRLGFGTNIQQYIGIFAGGNTLLANGLGAVIPIQAGLSAPAATTPFLNVQINGANGFYSKSGVQRSVQPNGLIAEAENNGFGLRFSRPGAKALYIQEFGLLQNAAPGKRQAWLRAGGFYNTTDYNRFDGMGTSDNWTLYAAADYQVFQRPGLLDSYKGIFAGLSAYVAPRNVNVYTQTYEARVYAIGFVPSRPFDLISLNIGYNAFSGEAGKAFAQLGTPAERGQFSTSALYSFRLSRGIFFTQSLTYFDRPTFLANYKNALNYLASVNILL